MQKVRVDIPLKTKKVKISHLMNQREQRPKRSWDISKAQKQQFDFDACTWKKVIQEFSLKIDDGFIRIIYADTSEYFSKEFIYTHTGVNVGNLLLHGQCFKIVEALVNKAILPHFMEELV